MLTKNELSLTDLEEFSIYRVIVTARFMEFGLSLEETTDMEITTSSAGNIIAS